MVDTLERGHTSAFSRKGSTPFTEQFGEWDGRDPCGPTWPKEALWREGMEAKLSYFLSSFLVVAPEHSHTHGRENMGQRATPEAPSPSTIHKEFRRGWLRNQSSPTMPRLPCWALPQCQKPGEEALPCSEQQPTRRTAQAPWRTPAALVGTWEMKSSDF